jgi:hypothetical protein
MPVKDGQTETPRELCQVRCHDLASRSKVPAPGQRARTTAKWGAPNPWVIRVSDSPRPPRERTLEAIVSAHERDWPSPPGGAPRSPRACRRQGGLGATANLAGGWPCRRADHRPAVFNGRPATASRNPRSSQRHRTGDCHGPGGRPTASKWIWAAQSGTRDWPCPGADRTRCRGSNRTCSAEPRHSPTVDSSSLVPTWPEGPLKRKGFGNGIGVAK